MDRIEYRRNLEIDGYRLYGTGSYACVYRHPKNPDEVIKVGYVNDDGYYDFIEMVGENTKNPYLPIVEEIKIFDSDEDDPFTQPFYSVRMECLEKRVNRTIRERWLKKFRLREFWELENLMYDRRSNKKTSDKYFEEVKDILMILFDHGHGADVHNGNVLWRCLGKNDYVPVFTDPVV